MKRWQKAVPRWSGWAGTGSTLTHRAAGRGSSLPTKRAVSNRASDGAARPGMHAGLSVAPVESCAYSIRLWASAAAAWPRAGGTAGRRAAHGQGLQRHHPRRGAQPPVQPDGERRGHRRGRHGGLGHGRGAARPGCSGSSQRLPADPLAPIGQPTRASGPRATARGPDRRVHARGHRGHARWPEGAARLPGQRAGERPRIGASCWSTSRPAGSGSADTGRGRQCLRVLKAQDEAFHDTRHQRCWFHKVSNDLNHLPKSLQPAVAADLREISHADTRAAALAGIETFREKYGAKCEHGVYCLTSAPEARTRDCPNIEREQRTRPWPEKDRVETRLFEAAICTAYLQKRPDGRPLLVWSRISMKCG